MVHYHGSVYNETPLILQRQLLFLTLGAIFYCQRFGSETLNDDFTPIIYHMAPMIFISISILPSVALLLQCCLVILKLKKYLKKNDEFFFAETPLVFSHWNCHDFLLIGMKPRPWEGKQTAAAWFFSGRLGGNLGNSPIFSKEWSCWND